MQNTQTKIGMKENIFFSIIIPIYNKAEYVTDTLNSVLNQSYKNYEILIVNDGSTDESLNILKKFNDPNITIINQENQGVSVARNNGIKNAKGDYIAFMDADDYWYPNHLSSIMESIKKHPKESVFCNNYEIYFSKYKFKQTSFNFNNREKSILKIENYFESSLINTIAWTSATCVKKNVLNGNMLFDPRLTSGQDTDLWIRLALKYYFIFNNTVTAKHNKYIEKSLSKSNTIKSRYLLTLKYLERESTNKSLKKYLDNNRFAIALQCKEKREYKLFKKLVSIIDPKNLNYKQKFILASPRLIILFLKKIKSFLMKNKINILLYK